MINNSSLEKLFKQFSRLKVAVAGDVMIDTYWWGQVDRISPEAPVPVVALQKKESRPGGAANVALNVKALGAEVSLFSVTGDDEDGSRLIKMLSEGGVDATGMIKSRSRITTSKSRIISRNQQMMRLDSEMTDDLNADDEIDFLNILLTQLERQRPDVFIFEDYNKGALTGHVIRQVIAKCSAMGISTCVDPKQRNFLEYRGATIFKPNLKEIREGLHMAIPAADAGQLRAVHESLQRHLGHEITFITLSDKGVFYQQNGESALIASHLRNIADVSGAGDTVIATAALVWAATHDSRLMAEIANIAGGLVCEEVGVVAIDSRRLQEECGKLLQ